MAITRYSKSVQHLTAVRNQLRNGAVVAAPTETAYGLLADATNVHAVRGVVRMKGREPGKPIALVAANATMVRRCFTMSPKELQLVKKFWPGPLTLLLRPKKKFPTAVVGTSGRVGVRVPGSAWLRKLSAAVGAPLTATSANRAGGPTPYSAAAVVRQLKHRGLKYLVDGGALSRQPTSTVASVVRTKLVVVREGAIPRARLARVLR